MTSATLPKKAVILGAAGFIGLNLARQLAAQSYDVVCFDRVASPDWPVAAKKITGDFYALPSALIEELDNALVFHLVSCCRPSSHTKDAADEISRDLVSTIRYLEVTKERTLRWVFLSSGGTVYGPHGEDLIDEKADTAPICSYGAMKLSIERYFELYHTLYGMDFVTVRLANPYGPGQHPLTGQGVIAALIYKAMKNEALEIWGDGENVRDYIYIEDAVKGIITAAHTGHKGETYNVGSASGLSINQLVKIIKTTLNLDLQVSYAPARSIDVRRNVLNSAKLTTHTGWRTETAMDSGLEMTRNWLQRFI